MTIDARPAVTHQLTMGVLDQYRFGEFTGLKSNFGWRPKRVDAQIASACFEIFSFELLAGTPGPKNEEISGEVKYRNSRDIKMN